MVDESGDNGHPRKRHSVAGRVGATLLGLVFLLMTVSVVARLIGNLSDGISADEWATIGIIAVLLAIVVVALLASELKERHPWAMKLSQVGRAVGSGVVTAYSALLVMCAYAVVLLAAFSPGLNRWVVDRPPVVQGLVFAALGAMVVVFLYRLRNKDRRGELLKKLVDGPLGVLTAPAFLVLAASVALTAASMLLLVGADHRWWDLRAPGGDDTSSQVVEIGGLADETLPSKLVLWEMLDLVPIVKIPRTLAWEEPPITYEDWGAGFVLLVFKGVAGVALLGAGRALFEAWPGRHARRAQRGADLAVDTGTHSVISVDPHEGDEAFLNDV